ncbi:MAG TPA: TIM-barrel domain-containing protein [Actinomycetota bacterium]|nr:TIM-barrel domain-containing protein [Actinomycetota bacterium]
MRRAGACEELELAWELEPDEHILGTGERYDALDQRGRNPDVRVYDQYKGQGSRTYFPVPFFLSSSGYGLFVQSGGRVRFDFGHSAPEVLRIRVPVAGDGVGGRLFLGDPKQVLQGYAALAGRPGVLPDWAYGPWMSGNEWNSETRVREVVERTLTEGIPATVIVIEAWSDETTFYLFADAEYEPVPGSDPIPLSAQRFGGRWPDPVGLVRWLHQKGLRLLLWQIPVLKDEEGHPQHDRDVTHAEDHGFCVRTVEGGCYRNRGWWFPGARVLDFTNPEARRWWFAKRRYLVTELGVDGFKTDGGEHLWGADVVTLGGERGDEAANRYPVHYQGAYHDFLRACGHQRPLTFSRSGFAGAQRFPAHWAGDEDSTWEAFRASVTAGLSAGASGIAYWGWDLAGFSGSLPSAELYCRAAAMAAFCPIMQYHSEFDEHREPPIDRTPWNVAKQTGDPRVLDVYRLYARLRMRLIPYLAQIGKEAAETGLPLMRAMALEFPDDPVCWEIADQFLLGPALLVAPVLREGVTERPVYLPRVEWRDFWSGQVARHGWIQAHAPLDRIPVFVREGPWAVPQPPQEEVG